MRGNFALIKFPSYQSGQTVGSIVDKNRGHNESFYHNLRELPLRVRMIDD